jgi:hypothetical protein
MGRCVDQRHSREVLWFCQPLWFCRTGLLFGFFQRSFLFRGVENPLWFPGRSLAQWRDTITFLKRQKFQYQSNTPEPSTRKHSSSAHTHTEKPSNMSNHSSNSGGGKSGSGSGATANVSEVEKEISVGVLAKAFTFPASMSKADVFAACQDQLGLDSKKNLQLCQMTPFKRGRSTLSDKPLRRKFVCYVPNSGWWSLCSNSIELFPSLFVVCFSRSPFVGLQLCSDSGGLPLCARTLAVVLCAWNSCCCSVCSNFRCRSLCSRALSRTLELSNSLSPRPLL